MKRGIYIIPSLLTLANLAAGVVAILMAANGRYTSAAWAIIFGICMDMMDGRIARWMGATSQFGLELDSLADVVTFGIAPGILMYQLALADMGRPGYMIAIFFAMTAALRLARFNLRAQQATPAAEPTSHFIGLPVPAAAGILASFVLSYELFSVGCMPSKTIPMVMRQMPLFFQMIPVTMLILSFLMISQVHYGDFKKLKMAGPKSLQSLTLISAALLLIFTYPQNTIFIVFSLYVLSGLWMFAWRYYRSRRGYQLGQIFHRRSTDHPEEVLAAGQPPAPPHDDKPGYN
jgi:CDP-diacylglycerol---serine O-phosphatidyltransferase